MVLSDKHLQGIAERHPADLAQLRGCPGIGPAKLESYGEEILAVVGSVEPPSTPPPDAEEPS